MTIISITTPNIDWNSLLLAGKSAIGSSISSILDTNGLVTGNPASYLVVLGGLIDPLIKPNAILTEAGGLLNHLSYGFLTILDTETLIELLESTKVHVHSVSLSGNRRLAVITANLAEWHEAIIATCSPIASTELRFLFDSVLLHFEKLGLHQVWGKYRKTGLPDKTFILGR